MRPARCAASTFSRTPPIGSTCPVSVISPVMPDVLGDGRAAHERRDRRCHRHAGGGPVLRHGARGNVHVHVVICEPCLGDPELLRVGAHPRERCLRRLLHHLAELAGDRQLALAGVRLRLDEEDVAAGSGVREPGRDTGIRSASSHLAGETARPEPRRARVAGRRGSSRSNPSATLRAALRQRSAMRRSSPRTPASRVYSRITSRSALSETVNCSGSVRAPRSASARDSAWRSRASRPPCSRRARSRPCDRAARTGSCRPCSRCR